jgi:hypothetical protein
MLVNLDPSVYCTYLFVWFLGHDSIRIREHKTNEKIFWRQNFNYAL